MYIGIHAVELSVHRNLLLFFFHFIFGFNVFHLSYAVALFFAFLNYYTQSSMITTTYREVVVPLPLCWLIEYLYYISIYNTYV